MRALALLICLVCLNANAGEVSAPQLVVEKYFEYFTDKDRDALNATTGQPFIFSINGHITRWDNYGDAVDFDGLRKSGACPGLSAIQRPFWEDRNVGNALKSLLGTQTFGDLGFR